MQLFYTGKTFFLLRPHINHKIHPSIKTTSVEILYILNNSLYLNLIDFFVHKIIIFLKAANMNQEKYVIL